MAIVKAKALPKENIVVQNAQEQKRKSYPVILTQNLFQLLMLKDKI
jgi:hypothetical protein